MWFIWNLKSKAVTWFNKTKEFWKQLVTWTLDWTKISWINKIIYFLTLTWISNIIYFSIVEELEKYSYLAVCIVIPIILSVFIVWNQRNAMWRFFQKIFFNDKEITIIFLSSLIIFLFNNFTK